MDWIVDNGDSSLKIKRDVVDGKPIFSVIQAPFQKTISSLQVLGRRGGTEHLPFVEYVRISVHKLIVFVYSPPS